MLDTLGRWFGRRRNLRVVHPNRRESVTVAGKDVVDKIRALARDSSVCSISIVDGSHLLARIGPKMTQEDFDFVVMSMKIHPARNSRAVTLGIERLSTVDAALAGAAASGDLAGVKAALKGRAYIKSANLAGFCPLLWAARSGSADVIKCLIELSGFLEYADSIDGSTALILAARGGHYCSVAVLVGAGADLEAADKGGHTALFWAAAEGHTEVVKLLAQRGANVNRIGRAGWPILTTACANGHKEVVEALLAQGAAVDAQGPFGCTALIATSAAGHADLVELLLAAGADPDAVTDAGSAALMEACAANHAATAEVLLSHGADAGVTNKDGKTALELAEMSGSREVVGLLAGKAEDTAGNSALLEHNLTSWRSSGQPQLWVKHHKGVWGHQDWLSLLEDLGASAFWPMEPGSVGTVLEGVKLDYWHTLFSGGGQRDRPRSETKGYLDRTRFATREEVEGSEGYPFAYGLGKIVLGEGNPTILLDARILGLDERTYERTMARSYLKMCRSRMMAQPS